MEPSRPEKILMAMFALSGDNARPCKYEDIVVKAFLLYPKDFQLRGHPQYPDSSDIHKPLYGPLKRMGFVRAANKTFSLTEKGLARAHELADLVRGAGPTDKDSNRLGRDVEAELGRLRLSSAMKLFLLGQGERILDTDLYAYLGVTVRTPRNDFLGRLKTVSDAVAQAVKIDPQAGNIALQELHRMLMAKFSGVIQRKSEERV